jgi:hypothetical protein
LKTYLHNMMNKKTLLYDTIRPLNWHGMVCAYWISGNCLNEKYIYI